MAKLSSSRSPRKPHGQSLVEFALTLMIMMWLLAGAVDFGMAFFSYVAIRDAAEEGALYGSIKPTCDIVTRVQQSAQNGPVAMSGTVVDVSMPAGHAQGDQLTVLVSYNYQLIMPLTSILWPNITLRAAATSVILKNDTCP